MHAASEMAERLAAVDPCYKAIVMDLAQLLREGRYNRALLLDAVFLADHALLEEEMRELRRAGPEVP